MLLLYILANVKRSDCGRTKFYNRHDLHALSTFFRYAIRQHWTRSNPIADVDIPSDAGAVRMRVLTPSEEQDYFQRAARLPNLYDVGRLMLNQGRKRDRETRTANYRILPALG